MAEEKRRDDERATAPDTARHRPRKNRTRWCKGRVGIDHQSGDPEPYHGAGWLAHIDKPLCKPRPLWAAGLKKLGPWWCNHVIRCTGCDKILENGLGDKCPDWRDDATP
jgi:hypothetical protein